MSARRAWLASGLRVRAGPAREVLHGIDLALPAGRWTAIVGPNGAGKTTLLQGAGAAAAARTARCAAGPPARGTGRRASAPAHSPGWGRARAGADDLRRTTS